MSHRPLEKIVFFLTAVLTCLLWSGASQACSVHDHGCVFHGVGRPVVQGVSGTVTPTSLTIYSTGLTTSGAVNRTDYDNVVLLPNGVGPYVVSVSGTDGVRGDQPYIGTSERPRAVSSNYYNILFNSNTATATHSGDFNGGEPIQAGMAGCVGGSSQAGCEIVKITGNVPSGVYKQKTHLYNFHNLTNPSATVASFAVATGSGVIVNLSHLGGTAANVTNIDTLTGQGATTPEYEYTFWNSGHNPHASGVALMHSRASSRRNMGTRTVQDDHTRQTYRDTQYSFYDKLNQINGTGEVNVLSETLTGRYTNSALVSTEKLIKPPVVDFGCNNGYASIPCEQLVSKNASFDPRVIGQYTDSTKNFINKFKYEPNASYPESIVVNPPSIPPQSWSNKHPYLNTAIDFIPVVGDVKGFIEIETWTDAGFAVVGLVPVYGDSAKLGYKLKKIADSSTELAEKVAKELAEKQAREAGEKAAKELTAKRQVKELEVGTYKDLKSRAAVGDKLEHDHIPSFAAVKAAKEIELGRPLTSKEHNELYNSSIAVEVPREVHVESRTFAGRNTQQQIAQDSVNLCGAVCNDTDALRHNLLIRGYDSKLVDETVNAIISKNKRNSNIKWFSKNKR